LRLLGRFLRLVGHCLELRLFRLLLVPLLLLLGLLPAAETEGGCEHGRLLGLLLAARGDLLLLLLLALRPLLIVRLGPPPGRAGPRPASARRLAALAGLLALPALLAPTGSLLLPGAPLLRLDAALLLRLLLALGLAAGSALLAAQLAIGLLVLVLPLGLLLLVVERWLLGQSLVLRGLFVLASARQAERPVLAGLPLGCLLGLVGDLGLLAAGQSEGTVLARLWGRLLGRSLVAPGQAEGPMPGHLLIPCALLRLRPARLPP